MLKGIIKWFDDEKGYGFINGKENEDIFVHYSSINIEGYKTLEEGQEVQYTLIRTNKGLQATNVVPISVNQRQLTAAF